MTGSTIHSTDQRVFDEFSPKKFILQIRSVFRYLLSKWYIILGAGLLLGSAGAIYSFTKKPIYTAEITFALDEGAAQSAKSEFSGLAEELGYTPVMNAGGVFSSMTNIVELIKSRLLIEKTLRSKTTIDNHTLTFADFFLDSLDLRKKWMKNSPYPHANFSSTPGDRNELLYINGMLRNMYEVLRGQMISVNTKSKGTTIISVTLVTRHELFSKYFLEALMAEVTHYYIETKTQRSKLNLDFIQYRTDSIKQAYNAALYGRAVFTDANINSIRQTATIPGEKQQTDVQILKNSYIEMVNALEAAKTTLMRNTPLIQYLDTPILPLKKTGSRTMLYFIVLFILGSLIAGGWLVAKKIMKNLMS